MSYYFFLVEKLNEDKRELAVNHYQSILNNPKQWFQPSQCTGILERDSLYKSAYYENDNRINQVFL